METYGVKWILYVNRRQSAQKHINSIQNHSSINRWIFILPAGPPFGLSITTLWNQSRTSLVTFNKQKLDETRPALVNRRGSILIHSNAQQHVARMTQNWLEDFYEITFEHSSYCPDISPTIILKMYYYPKEIPLQRSCRVCIQILLSFQNLTVLSKMHI